MPTERELELENIRLREHTRILDEMIKQLELSVHAQHKQIKAYDILLGQTINCEYVDPFDPALGIRQSS